MVTRRLRAISAYTPVLVPKGSLARSLKGSLRAPFRPQPHTQRVRVLPIWDFKAFLGTQNHK